eukprot:TRINITY_DN34137_c0_g1_i1.p1 TRINITY_DN34137_c0_g1~~TRINITY_DN34137_c0_g1_i1.p1  ORF type:complete len:236 (+),score=32.71 TRINITY_DN34137_c0_g1_i1:2-709(+)
MIRRPPRSQLSSSSAASDVYKRQIQGPFGAPAQNATSFQHLVLVGLGVGSTPMLSIANEVMQAQARPTRDKSEVNRLDCALLPPMGCRGKVLWFGGSAIWAVGSLVASVSLSMVNAVGCVHVGLGLGNTPVFFAPLLLANFIFMTVCQHLDPSSPSVGVKYLVGVCLTWLVVAPASLLIHNFDHAVDNRTHCQLYVGLDILIDILYLIIVSNRICLLYTSPSPRDRTRSRMPSSA